MERHVPFHSGGSVTMERAHRWLILIVLCLSTSVLVMSVSAPAQVARSSETHWRWPPGL